MKICPACHHETFDGRRACHRCGADVVETLPIALPSRDPATHVRPLPFSSQDGDLVLDIDGLTFYAEDGRPKLHIPMRAIEAVEPSRGRDLLIRWRSGGGIDRPGRRARTRLRVRWAPQADSTLRSDWVSAGSIRTGYGVRSPRPRNRRTGRDYAVVRDRWLSGLEMLLAADRYALGRPPLQRRTEPERGLLRRLLGRSSADGA